MKRKALAAIGKYMDQRFLSGDRSGETAADLKEHTGEEEDWAEEYRNQLWTARYGKRRLQKDEFVRCLMELKYLAEGTTLNLGGDRKRWVLKYFPRYV